MPLNTAWSSKSFETSGWKFLWPHNSCILHAWNVSINTYDGQVCSLFKLGPNCLVLWLLWSLRVRIVEQRGRNPKEKSLKLPLRIGCYEALSWSKYFWRESMPYKLFNVFNGCLACVYDCASYVRGNDSLQGSWEAEGGSTPVSPSRAQPQWPNLVLLVPTSWNLHMHARYYVCL